MQARAVKARLGTKRDQPKPFAPDKKYLRKIISDERRIHRARILSHRITALKLLAATKPEEAQKAYHKIERLQKKQEGLLEGITDKSVLRYVKEESAPLTKRGFAFIGKR
jgi:hypothetical protein